MTNLVYFCKGYKSATPKGPLVTVMSASKKSSFSTRHKTALSYDSHLKLRSPWLRIFLSEGKVYELAPKVGRNKSCQMLSL